MPYPCIILDLTTLTERIYYVVFKFNISELKYYWCSLEFRKVSVITVLGRISFKIGVWLDYSLV